MKQPKVSLIIITLNRGEVLVHTLQDAVKQDYPDYEIVVYDQSDQPNPGLETFLKQHKDIIYIHVDWKDQPRSRNLGAKASKGEILVYIDDDVHIEPEFLSQHVAAYKKDKAIGAVTGAVITPHDASPIGGSFVTSLGNIVLNRDAREAGYIDVVFGCNMSFRREAWEKVGGFDETVKSTNLEEAFICLQLKQAGYKMYYDPKPVTLHFINPSGGTRNFEQRIQWYYPWFYNQFYFFLRFFSRPLLPLFLVTKWRPLVACMFFYGRGKPKALFTPWRALRDVLRDMKTKEAA